MIVHHNLIFTTNISGPRYQKYDNTNANLNFLGNSNEIELFVDDADEYLSTNNPPNFNNSESASTQNDTFNSNNFFDLCNYSEEFLHNPYRVYNYHLNSVTNQHQYNSLMNASICSGASSATGVHGLSNYSDCLPPSITATLVKPVMALNENSKIKLDTDNNFIKKEQNSSYIDDDKAPHKVIVLSNIKEKNLNKQKNKIEITNLKECSQNQPHINNQTQIISNLNQLTLTELQKKSNFILTTVKKNEVESGNKLIGLFIFFMNIVFNLDLSHQSLRGNTHTNRTTATSKCSNRSNSSSGGHRFGGNDSSLSNSQTKAVNKPRDFSLHYPPRSPLQRTNYLEKSDGKQNFICGSSISQSTK